MRSYVIGSFHKIGWNDPFAHEELNSDLESEIPKPELNIEIDTPVYNLKRLVPGMSPSCLWMPKKELMVKLMRACINARTKNDLWFNRKKTWGGLSKVLDSKRTSNETVESNQ